MRVSAKGQVTIPVEIRESAGLLPHTEVEFNFTPLVCTFAALWRREAKDAERRRLCDCGAGRRSA
jgi:bifunctional DNA-binding transcriptional regulator/antitoxin component of YhaV-PrlF toxin-antitoxin module